MKIVLQRVSRAKVTIDGQVTGEIGKGLLLLVGVADDDAEDDAKYCAQKCAEMRIFQDENDKMNRSVLEENGEILAISQFTLLANTRKGRRPSFIGAADPEKGNELYEQFVNYLKEKDINVATGRFGAMMDVELVNAGPVTIILDSKLDRMESRRGNKK